MLATEIKSCPRCQGAIDREHYAEVHSEDCLETYLYCDFCGIGWETTEFLDGYMLSLDYHAAIEPKNFERFMCRLQEARFG